MEFYGCPKIGGAILQTIPGRFTCMTTFSHWIAVCGSDGIVRIYHAVTGVLRQSLEPMVPITAVRGSPDGSTLFCTHQTHQKNSITLWDIQKGKLIHTFSPMEEIQHFEISLKGCYFACGFSSGSVKVWEVANRVEGVTIQCSPSNIPFCWLKLEEQLVIADKESVHIWDIVAGRIVCSFRIIPDHQKGRTEIERLEWISGMAYSQTLDQLVILTKFSSFGGTITIIHLQSHTHSAPFEVQEDLTCIALSQATEEIVCGIQDNGLSVLKFSKELWSKRYIGDSHTVKHISPLPNGTIVVDSGNPSVQLLSLDAGYSQGSPSIFALTISTLDKGRIIALHSSTHAQLLETSTMSNLITTSTLEDSTITLTTVLCASLENHMAVYYLPLGLNVCLMLYRFGKTIPRWTVEVEGWLLAGGISPAGTWLVTFHDVQHASHIYLWDTKNGKLQTELLVDVFTSSPSHITFDSDMRFYSYHNNYSIPYDLNFSPGAEITYSIIHHKQQPWTVELCDRQYEVNSSHEWVISNSKRICWVPPGYIGSTEGNYCWAGSNSLVMIGKDKMLRKLTFCL